MDLIGVGMDLIGVPIGAKRVGQNENRPRLDWRSRFQIYIEVVLLFTFCWLQFIWLCVRYVGSMRKR